MEFAPLELPLEPPPAAPFVGAVAVIASFLLVWLGTRALIRLLEARAILDRPNERSSHDRPVPRGGGLALLGVLLPLGAVSLLLAEAAPRVLLPVMLGTAGLAAVSWLDDIRGLGAAPRLAAHGAAAGAGLLALPLGAAAVSLATPVWLTAAGAAVLWVWFVNLYNFMDGIDGIAGVETLTVSLGIALIASTAPGVAGLAPLALACAGAALGFLAWNWHPARIFMGDVGSVPLGFLLGWMLLYMAAMGHWAAALLLPLYYLVDATFTIGRRALRGAPIWKAHKEHIYQLAVQRGRSHAAVSGAVAVENLILIGCAYAAERGQIEAAFSVAGVTLILLIAYLLPRRARPVRK